MLEEVHMQENLSIGLQKAKKTLCIKSQLALDVANFLDEFPNKSLGLRFLSKEAGVNEKTIKRILQKENKPTYQTLMKLYPVLISEDNQQKLIERCPEVVRNVLEKRSPRKNFVQTEESSHFLELVKREPLMAELYILVGTGTLYKSAISYRYGQYGIELLDKLENAGFIYTDGKGRYSLSPKAPLVRLN